MKFEHLKLVPRLADDGAAFAAALRAHAELYARGWTEVLALTGQEEAVVVVNGPRLADVTGLIVFEPCDDISAFWVQLSWVSPKARRRGIWRRMWNVLVEEAWARGILKIQSGHHVDNEPMRRAMLSAGRRPKMILYDYDVERLTQAEDGPV